VTRVALEIPKVGLVMENARLIRWLKNVGDVVEQGEPLLELETEKSVVEIESTESGRLVEILMQADQEARVGDRVAWLENDTVATVSVADTQTTPTLAASADISAPNSPRANQARNTGRIMSSPVARRIAAAHAVDLRQITGTGPEAGCSWLTCSGPSIRDLQRKLQPVLYPVPGHCLVCDAHWHAR
jgi:pyruvate dehydrogenase E2 component (dihydrolipoamide acetyltransferase)